MHVKVQLEIQHLCGNTVFLFDNNGTEFDLLLVISARGIKLVIYWKSYQTCQETMTPFLWS